MQPGLPHPHDTPLVYPWLLGHQGQMARSKDSTSPSGIRSLCLRRQPPPDPPDFSAHLAIAPSEQKDCLWTGRSANLPRDTVYTTGPAHCHTSDGHVRALLLTFTSPPLVQPSPRPPLECHGRLKSCSSPFEERKRCCCDHSIGRHFPHIFPLRATE